MTDKRFHFRKDLPAEGMVANATGSTWTTIRLLDLSKGGIGFMCPSDIPVGGVRMVRFRLPSPDQWQIGAVVKIIYCVKHRLLGGYRLGAEFSHLDDDGRVRIACFVETTQD